MAEPTPKWVAVTGASGFIGSALVRHLESTGVRVTRLVRRPPRPGHDEVAWSLDAGLADTVALDGVDAVVHLAGANVGQGRWTPSRRREILHSRVHGTRSLAESLAKMTRPPRVLVSGSATGYYGDGGDRVLDEDGAPGEGFLAQVCAAWESAAEPARDARLRVVHPRFHLVLGKDGGALRRLLPIYRSGLGGPVAGGAQWVSWISRTDTVAALHHMLASNLRGPTNVVAPHPVHQREFAKTLGRVVGRPAILPTPAWGVRMGFGGMGTELMVWGQRASPARLLESGFQFRHADLETALRAELNRPQ